MKAERYRVGVPNIGIIWRAINNSPCFKVKVVWQTNVKNAEYNYLGGLELGSILRVSLDTPYKQGKVIWQTNVKNVENNNPGVQS